MFQYCPDCCTKNSIIEKDSTHYQCNICSWDFWNNPKAATAIIFVNKNQEVLFSERARDPDKGKYGFPGGFVDYGEDVFKAAVREVHEETGMKIKPTDLTILTTYTVEYIPYVTTVDIILVADVWSGPFKAADDVADLAWKPMSFVKDEQFRPDYPDFEQKLKAYLAA